MKELCDIEGLEQCLADSQEQAVFILKHSTRCPISAGAFDRTARFFEEADAGTPECFLVKVLEHRDVSDAVAERLGVEHRSPQLLLVREGACAWMRSHHNITGENIQEALAGG